LGEEAEYPFKRVLYPVGEKGFSRGKNQAKAAFSSLETTIVYPSAYESFMVSTFTGAT
jgi:hypothetical protein